MDRSSPVRDVMQTNALTFGPADGVEESMRKLVDLGVRAAPVVDAEGNVVGVLSDADLIVQETQLHFPTLIAILGGTIELGHKRFEEDLTKALASTVGEVMTADPVTCREDDTIEHAATLLHDNDVAVLPVVRDRELVGVIDRTAVLRAILGSR